MRRVLGWVPVSEFGSRLFRRSHPDRLLYARPSVTSAIVVNTSEELECSEFWKLAIADPMIDGGGPTSSNSTRRPLPFKLAQAAPEFA